MNNKFKRQLWKISHIFYEEISLYVPYSTGIYFRFQPIGKYLLHSIIIVRIKVFKSPLTFFGFFFFFKWEIRTQHTKLMSCSFSMNSRNSRIFTTIFALYNSNVFQMISSYQSLDRLIKHGFGSDSQMLMSPKKNAFFVRRQIAVFFWIFIFSS